MKLGTKVGWVAGITLLAQGGIIAVLQPMLRDEIFDLRCRDVLSALESAGALEKCDAAPASFRFDDRGFGGIWPVDAGGRPYHPEAPRVSVKSLVGLTPTHAIGAEVERTVGEGARVHVMERDGPCRYFLMVQTAKVLGPAVAGTAPAIREAQQEIRRLMWIRGATGAASVLAAWALIALPLVLRIRKVRDQALQVVASDFEGAVDTGKDEVGELAETFNHAALTARASIARERDREILLRNTLADLSHDVRTPLGALKLGLERLQAKPGHGDAAVAVRAEVEHLDALFANLTALAQLEGTTLELTPRRTSLVGCAEKVSTRFRVLAEEQQVELNLSLPDGDLTAHVDPIAIQQILSNLVHNALKFAEGHVALSLFKEGDEAIFEIRDDGPGVEIAEIPRLTDRHFRGERSRDRGRPGMGLGLAIAGALTERHQGCMIIRRHREGGTCAQLRLPLSVAPKTDGGFHGASPALVV